ncbi:MAG: o-succinylbenzoate--CoA ligase [Thermaerobacter sp.]|nr:o-succinylbenzoate--CoA ligase [Thermaerobacter sp.]
MTSSPDWLRHQADVHPDRPALITPAGRWSFAELDARVGTVAASLSELGVTGGNRVAYLLPATAEQVMLVHALTRMGAVLVPLNTRLTPDELAPILIDADPRLVIHDQSPLPAPPGVLSLSVREVLGGGAGRRPTGGRLRFDALHALVYTSGTTGRPKGVELTIANQWWSAVGFALNGGLQAQDRWLHVMPLFHVGGLTILFRSVIHGSTVVLEPRFDAGRTYELMVQEEITLVSVVPTMVHRLLALNKKAPSSLRLALLGGAPASIELLQRARRQGYPVVPTYGMTETCSQVVTLDLDQVSERKASSGHPNLPTEIRIVRDGTDCAPEELGEIWVKSPSVARGYWRNPQATAQAFADGWLKTGDIGFVDADGYLTVTDRLKDLIVRGGENVSPREVEDLILSYPGVRDAAVFGLSHPEWGQIVAAALVTGTDVTLGPLRLFLSNHLASYKMPSVYFRLEEIPRNAGGKILRTELLQLAQTMPRWVDSP